MNLICGRILRMGERAMMACLLLQGEQNPE